VRLRDGAAAHTVNLPTKRIAFSADKRGVIHALSVRKRNQHANRVRAA
jgi:hypothetical protein